MSVHLHQVIAREQGTKPLAENEISRITHMLENTSAMSGMLRVYTPSEEQGETFPPESKRVQYSAREVLEQVRKPLGEMFDLVATKEMGNTRAKANIVVEGKILVESVPATLLLYLEKRLEMLYQIAKKIPTLDQTFSWHFDSQREFYVTDPTKTNRTKKVARAFVLHEGNQYHAPQVQRIDEDVVIGTWDAVQYSGAMHPREQRALLERITTLKTAVHEALEEANRVAVEQVQIAGPLLTYLFA